MKQPVARNPSSFVHADHIRAMFSRELSAMYSAEVPKYATLLKLVAKVNVQAQDRSEPICGNQRPNGQHNRLGIERHGAIRLGSAEELKEIRRLFAVMGMSPTGYYDLSAAGMPVHATAFRPTNDLSLQCNPLRIFTSLLRVELIQDAGLRATIERILSARQILTSRCRELIERFEVEGGLSESAAREFVTEALQAFCWRGEATVNVNVYRALKSVHPLIADVVCFKGPHINHLTPRVLDIDKAHEEMRKLGLQVKETIEGPPKRKVPILLRQTSFLAQEEPIHFAGAEEKGTHTARFGEIEQRGCALTPKGRALYDTLLSSTLLDVRKRAQDARQYSEVLAHNFRTFPDEVRRLHHEKLAYFRYSVNEDHVRLHGYPPTEASIDALVDAGWILIEPQVYEDFLPVSAAGIFQSNLNGQKGQIFAADANRTAFEEALDTKVVNEFELYEAVEIESLEACMEQVRAKC